MSQRHQLSACPSCEEPLESGDLFCGACGYDLSAVPPPPQDRPTMAMGSPVGGAAWPAARPPAGPPGGRPPAAPAAVRFDARAADGGDFELPAPAPGTA
ncbi:serine/threonine-protein phosphatase, partial [Streptomyces sp. WAC05374]